MFSDLRLASRTLAKSPAFCLIALLTLTLGIGVNTSMFSVLNTLLLHQPAYASPDTLFRLYRTTRTLETGPHSPANFLDLRAQTKAFSHLAAFVSVNSNYASPGQPAEQVRGLAVTGEFFAALGISPAQGRALTAEDDRRGHHQVVVLSHPTWQQRFAGDPTILGRQIRLDGDFFTVVGVMPAGFEDPLVWGPVALWRPLAFQDDDRANRGANWLSVLGRLAPGVSGNAALAEITAINAALAAAHPGTNAQSGINLVPLDRSLQDRNARTLSLFAMGLAGCVLLIACANLANLFFARNVTRHRDQAIRAALGASRAHLIRQTLAESFVLAAVGGPLGLLLAAWSNTFLSAQLQLGGGQVLLTVDWRVAAFALLAAAGAAVGFGLLPAFLASRTDVNEALKQGTRGSTSSAHHRLRHGLIVTEVALALVLLTGASFFLDGLDRFLGRDSGWITAGLLTGRIDAPGARYGTAEKQAELADRLLRRLEALPGVEHVALSRSLPFNNYDFSQRFVVEGRPEPTPGSEPMRDVNTVTPDYFTTLGIPVLEGRSLIESDRTGPMRTVISESMARQVWPGESAIGKRIMHPVAREWQEIVGVVRDVKFASNLERTNFRFQTYRLFAREPDASIAVALRSSIAPEILAASVRRVVTELDGEMSVNELQPAPRVIEQNVANYSLTAGLLTGFAVLGLLLAALGIYGVISGSVAQRTTEIGIRMALGAQRGSVLRLVLRQGLVLASWGSLLGLAGAWGVARLLQSLVPALPAASPLAAGGVCGLLLAIAALASWLPARRATRVDPIIALRSD